MTALVDIFFLTQLNKQDPADVCRRSLCAYDETDRTYRATVWGDQYVVDPEKAKITCIDTKHEPLHPYFDLFVVHYLLGCREMQPAGQWISEKDIAGGATFFRGPHEIPAHSIASRFDRDIIGFKKRCQQYGGLVLNLADAAFVFSIAPGYRLRCFTGRGMMNFPLKQNCCLTKPLTATWHQILFMRWQWGFVTGWEGPETISLPGTKPAVLIADYSR